MKLGADFVEMWCQRVNIEGRQRRVLFLHWCDELSFEQIAERLSIAPKTVQTHYYRAKKKILRSHAKETLLEEFYTFLLQDAIPNASGVSFPVPHFNVTGVDRVYGCEIILGDRQPAHGGKPVTVDDLVYPGHFREVERQVEDAIRGRKR